MEDNDVIPVETGIQVLLPRKYGFLLEFIPYLIRGRNDKAFPGFYS
jgi:hypothetical protein